MRLESTIRLESNTIYFLSLPSSLITSNFLTTVPITFTYPFQDSDLIFHYSKYRERESPKEFSKTPQHGASCKGSLGPEVNLGKAKAWSNRTLQLKPRQCLELEK